MRLSKTEILESLTNIDTKLLKLNEGKNTLARLQPDRIFTESLICWLVGMYTFRIDLKLTIRLAFNL